MHDRWIAFLILVLLAGILMQLPLLVILSVMMALVLSCANWWRAHALEKVLYRRRFHFYRMFPGEKSVVQLLVENRKILPIPWLKVRDYWPLMVSPVRGDAAEEIAPMPISHIPGFGVLENVFSMLWFEREIRTYQLFFQKRGVYPLMPAHLSTTDLFGFYAIESMAIYPPEHHVTALDSNKGPGQRLVVFPEPKQLRALDLPQENPFGANKSKRRLFEDPNLVIGIRQYHPEDEFRRIHWPASARTGQLQVKVFQPTAAPVLMVAVNGTTSENVWGGYNAAKLEHIVSIAAYICKTSIEDGYIVGLLSNSCLRQADQPFRVPPGRSPQQLGQLLEALAAVSPLTSGSFEGFIQKDMNRIPYGSILVVLTAILPESLLLVLSQIRKHERKIIVISVEDQLPPKIPGITIIHSALEKAA